MATTWKHVLLSVAIVACISLNSATARASDGQRFQLSGSGTLQIDAPSLQNGNVRLKAYLTPNAAATTLPSSTQQNSRFTLNANLATESMVCYNDTIFRDDFDGDGF